MISPGSLHPWTTTRYLNTTRSRISLTSDNDGEESCEEPEHPQRPARSEVFEALELLKHCSFFEGEQVASDLRSHLEEVQSYMRKL